MSVPGKWGGGGAGTHRGWMMCARMRGGGGEGRGGGGCRMQERWAAPSHRGLSVIIETVLLCRSERALEEMVLCDRAAGGRWEQRVKVRRLTGWCGA